MLEAAAEVVEVEEECDAERWRRENPRPVVEASLAEKTRRAAAMMVTADSTAVTGPLDPSVPAEAQILEWLRGPAAFHLGAIAAARVHVIEPHLEGVRLMPGVPSVVPSEDDEPRWPGEPATLREIHDAVMLRMILEHDGDGGAVDPEAFHEEVDRHAEAEVTVADLVWIRTPGPRPDDEDGGADETPTPDELD
ncbi:hypothetical protein [Aurantimonas sp. VKM B-3413]|uniref:hypothetical protein n=1 Tax=Aurantimonas sp. VKM B-3413 TaxID=2779401 RepID=UPI001E3684AE|nr:hypothetical protein [Aurantimonas sp. VKM B-3413]MCB8840198.1 hypothetical protein [Aurantimonas sp. VKM B-3413]